jgi:hypothetical protein
MRKIFWMMSIALLSCTMVHAQDQYGDSPPPQQNSDDAYYQDNTYNEDQDQGDNGGNVTYQTFYDQLSPYGSWIDYPGRGYVWVPQVSGDFAPYETDGHWVYTDYGWTWVSDYGWGWAAFHYGRWFNDPDYGGWLWAPGYDWAPAWVTWGEYGGYYCWAPLGWGERFGGNYSNRNWYFCNKNYITDGRVQNHIVNHDVVSREAGGNLSVHVIDHSNTYNHSVFSAGPRAEDVQKAVGHPIQAVKINNAARPGATSVKGGAVDIYRPAMSRNAAVHAKAVPATLSRPQDVHPAKNDNNNHVNTQPARNNSQPERTAPENNEHIAEQPYRAAPTPPRQNTTREESQPARSEPSRPSGGFVPSERPAPEPSFHSAPMRAAPAAAPAFHGGGGGVSHGGGGGRH